jgi:hypothetical protein
MNSSRAALAAFVASALLAGCGSDSDNIGLPGQPFFPPSVSPTVSPSATVSPTPTPGQQVEFLAPTTLAHTSAPGDVQVGDVTGDGLLDVVGIGGGNVTIHAGNGGGQFAPPTSAFMSGPRLLLADLNGDSRLDLVSPTQFRLNGASGFGFSQALPVGSRARAVAVANLFGTAAPDIVVADPSSGTVHLLVNNGAGAFTALPALSGFLTPTAVAPANLNGDGFVDLLVADSTQLQRFVNDGTTLTALAPIDFGNSSNERSLAVGDVNGDGRADVIVGSRTTTPTVGTLAVYFGQADGGLSAPVVLSDDIQPAQVDLVDINADGRSDIVVAGSFDGTVLVFLGNGNGTFTELPSVVVGTTEVNPLGVAAADLNGDSKVDLLSADGDRATFSVLLRR